MALQEDPTKSFGSTSYFRNKDDERKAVNAVRQEERQKRIATQLLRRNMKKAMRKGEDGGRFIQSAKAAELDIFGRTGLGEEASQAMARARFDVNQNFDAAAKAKAQLEAGVGPDGKPVLDANGKPVVGQQIAPQQTTPQQVGNVASAQPAVSNTQPQNKTPKPTAPDWARDVENDRTFGKGFFDDPANLARIQGMTRAEAYDMLRKEQAAKFMAGATARGETLKNKEIAEDAAVLGKAMFDQQIKFNNEVDSKVNETIAEAGKSLVKKSIKLPDGTFVDGLSTTDLNALRDAKEIASIVNNIDTTDKGGLTPEYVNNLITGLQERNTNPFFTYENVKGKAKIVKAGDTNGKLSSYKSEERVAYDNLVKQGNNYNSPLRTNARNQVVTEAKAKEQRANELRLKQEQYRQQRQLDLQAMSTTAAMFGLIGNP